jgi:TolB-like protein/Flp pilus assembly protein TadD
MGEQSPEHVSTPTGAVFLSYASQDADAAKRICDALRAAGIEVWFDQSQLRGGDIWDQKIRQQIRDCALFIPVISANTASRREGYFRLEWDLADQRSHRMARDQAFIMPVCLDATPGAGTDVPESFHRVQWTRLPAGETPPEFVARIERLLSPESPTTARLPADAASGSSPISPTTIRPSPLRRALPVAVAILALAALAYLLFNKPWISKPAAAPTTSNATSSTASPAAFTPPPHSIAVLPFVDMSENKDQEYFSDGLAEELLELLAKTPGLHVIARTSSFSFKGKSDDIPTIAAKLRVANILEGSVRKSGHRLRVSTQLVRAADGEQLWSETYDRQLKDVFQVQEEIAGAVVTALKLKLAPAQQSSPIRSSNTDAYLQYLLGQQHLSHATVDGFRGAVTAYRNAIALDPHYAAAYAGLAYALNALADATGDTAGLQESSAAAQRAVELAPDQPMGYAARGFVRSTFWEWVGAQADFAKALELDPNDADVLRRYANLSSYLGRLPEGIELGRKAADLDPFSAPAWQSLDSSLIASRDFVAAREANRRALAIDPAHTYALNDLGTLELLEHRPAEALAVFQKIGGLGFRLPGIAMAQYSLGHAKESQHALDEAIAKRAQVAAYEIAEAYAWRGEADKAFEWLERAYRQSDGGLATIKTDRLLDSLHSDPRYNRLLAKINLPD